MTKKFRKSYIFILFLFAISNTYSQRFVIEGKITNFATKESIMGARIIIENSTLGSISNKSGDFKISNVTAGKHKVVVSMIGYQNQTINLDLNKNEYLEIQLKESDYFTDDIKKVVSGGIVVSANKRVQAVQDVPISVSVMDSKTLMQRGATRLDDALEYISGIEVNTDNVSVRGSSGFSFGIGSRVALLIDGFPIISGDAGDIKFDAVPIFNLDRIEVVKGAGSALYGTGALGGVINVITTAPTENAVINYRAYSGIYTQSRFDQWKYTDELRLNSGINLGYMQKIGDLSLNISGGYINNQSYRFYDDSYSWNLFGKFSYNLSDFTEISLMANTASEDRADWVYWRNLDNATLPPETSDISIRINSFKHSVFTALRHIIDDNNFVTAKVGMFITDFKNNYEVSNPEHRQSQALQLNSEIQGNSKLASSLQLTYGLNYMNVSVDSKTYGIHSQQIYSFYTQAEYDGISSAIFTLGGRFDLETADEIENNLQFSPKFGVSYAIYDKLNLRASIGNGFRVPTVAERFASVSFQGFKVIPNLNLKPEKSWSFEAGMNYEFEIFKNPFYIDFAVFNNELSDLIEPTFAKDGNAEIQFQNVTEARVSGIEIGLRTFLLGFLGYETSITFMEPKDLVLDEELKYRPKLLFYNKFMLPLGFIELQADYRYKSKFNNIDPELGLIIKDVDSRVDIHIVDARIAFDLHKINENLPLIFTISANNLLDYYYAEMVGNLGHTRYLSLRIEGKF